jgi:hypothetical protein
MPAGVSELTNEAQSEFQSAGAHIETISTEVGAEP